MCLFVFWVCLCAVFGLGSKGMQTYHLVSGNEGDLWSKGALEEVTSVLLAGLRSKAGFGESGENKRKEECHGLVFFLLFPVLVFLIFFIIFPAFVTCVIVCSYYHHV